MKKVRGSLILIIVAALIGSIDTGLLGSGPPPPPPPPPTGGGGGGGGGAEEVPPVVTVTPTPDVTTEVSLAGTGDPGILQQTFSAAPPPQTPTASGVQFESLSLPTQTAITSATLFTGLSPFLYMQMSTRDFSTWGNLSALVYLLLLFLNFGMGRSVTQFAEEYGKNKITHRSFIRSIVLFKLGVILVGLLILIPLLRVIIGVFNLSTTVALLPLGIGLFFTEGMASTVRLVFYANFWNRQFNVIARSISAAQMIANLVLIIGTKPSSSDIIYIVFLTKIVGAALVAAIGLFMLLRLRGTFKAKDLKVDTKKLDKDFIRHTGVVWGTTSMKNFTESNALLPLFTALIGPAQANLFKVSYDGASLFYKSILRNMGTGSAVPGFLKAKSMKVATFIGIPLAILMGGFAFIRGTKIFGYQSILILFVIMSAGYFVEALLSRHEYVLEGKRNYRALLYSYTPYVFLLGLLYFSNMIPLLGLAWTMAVIHSVRSFSSLLMMYATRKG